MLTDIQVPSSVFSFYLEWKHKLFLSHIYTFFINQILIILKMDMRGVCVFSCFQGPSIAHALPEVFKKASNLTKRDTHLLINHDLDWASAKCKTSTKQGAGEGMVLQTQLLPPHPLSDPAALSRCRLLSWSHLPGYIPTQEKHETELNSNTTKKCVPEVPAGPHHSLAPL